MSVARMCFAMVIFSLFLAAVTWPVPFVPQQDNTCAAASLAMVMRYWGQAVSSDEIVEKYIDEPRESIRGSQLVEFARSKGLYAVAYMGDLAQVKEYVIKGRPLIVALGAGKARFHDVVLVGFDKALQEFLIHDPARGPNRRMRCHVFEERWKEAGCWTLLVLPAKPQPSE